MIRTSVRFTLPPRDGRRASGGLSWGGLGNYKNATGRPGRSEPLPFLLKPSFARSVVPLGLSPQNSIRRKRWRVVVSPRSLRSCLRYTRNLGSLATTCVDQRKAMLPESADGHSDSRNRNNNDSKLLKEFHLDPKKERQICKSFGKLDPQPKIIIVTE